MRRLFIRILFAVTVATLLVSAAGLGATPARTLYVAAGGRDSGSCARARPCRTFLYATRLAHPGETVLVRAGVYPAQAIFNVHGGTRRPIVVRAQGTVTLTRPRPADAQQQAVPLLSIVDSSYLVVRGLRAIGMKARPDYVASARPFGGEVVISDHGRSPAHGRGIVLDRLLVEHANNTCIKTEDAEVGVVVEHSVVVDCGRPGSGLDHGIYISGPATVVRGNVVRGATGYGIHVYGAHTGDDTVIDNRVSGARLGGVLDLAPPATIAGNLVYANGFGVSAGPDMHIAGNIIALNSVPNGGQHGYGLLIQGKTGDLVYGNTFYENGIEMQAIRRAPGPPSRFIDNVFWGLEPVRPAIPPTALAPGDVFSHNDYFHAGAPTAERRPLTASPGFRVAGHDFRLRARSRLLGAGLRLVLPTGCSTRDIGAEPYRPPRGCHPAPATIG